MCMRASISPSETDGYRSIEVDSYNSKCLGSGLFQTSNTCNSCSHSRYQVGKFRSFVLFRQRMGCGNILFGQSGVRPYKIKVWYFSWDLHVVKMVDQSLRTLHIELSAGVLCRTLEHQRISYTVNNTLYSNQIIISIGFNRVWMWQLMLVEYVCNGSVTLCNGKTLEIPKNIGEDNNRGLSFPKKDAKGSAYMYMSKKSYLI